MAELPFAELLGPSHDAVLVLDVGALVLDVNEEACRSLGYTREELLGKHVTELVEGLDGSALEKLTAVLRAQGVQMLRAFHRRKDGSRFPVETRVAVVQHGGSPRVVAFARDLSAEQGARLALEQSEERHRRLLDLLPDGVVTYRDGRITFANPAAARLIGAERPEQLVGTPVIARVHPNSQRLVVERMGRVARGEQVPLLEEILLRLDGTPFHTEVAAAPLGSGEVLVVIRDVSERHRAESERTALKDRLRQAEKLEALGTLAGGVAHDFNNVLAAILGHADSLAREAAVDSPVHEDATQIAAAARRARGVVQQILAFARRRPAEVTAVDVAATVREELPLVRAATPSTIEIALRAASDAGEIRADPTQIHQVLLNLCSNARDAMARRGGTIEITVARSELPDPAGAPPGLPPGSYVRISVADTGDGMDAAVRARAFEPYFTTKPIGVGSGLGLSVVHGIASGLGGAVSLESTPGKGTRVDVWLPRLATPESATPPRPRAPAAPARNRVLLVDDDPPVARAIGRMLELCGYRVTIVEDAESGLERFRADPSAFDLVLTDETLPRMRGADLTRALLEIRPGLPVVICTGYSDALDEARARAAGARALLPKPLDVHELAEALRDALSS